MNPGSDTSFAQVPDQGPAPVSQGSSRKTMELPLSDPQPTALPADHARCLSPPRKPGFLGRIGEYDILKLCGSGGMGCVFLATREEPDSSAASEAQSIKQFAIKVLRPDLTNNIRARNFFLKESRHLQRLVHPNILRPLEIQSEGPVPFLVFPFLKNGSLADQLQSGKQLPLDLILRWGIQISLALEHSHAAGVIHRDIKPANVLLDESMNARLVDFGLACSLFNDSMLLGSSPDKEGTPPYMSPERARGEAGDTRCDIYAVGCLLYELLTGHPPYSGRTSQDVVRKIIDWPPSPVWSMHPETPKYLARIVEKAMARDLRKRYAHARYIREDLESFARTQEAGSPSNAKPWRRKVLILGSILALGAAALLSPWVTSKHTTETVVVKTNAEPVVSSKLELWRRLELPSWEDNSSHYRLDFNNDQLEDFLFFSGRKLVVMDRNGFSLATRLLENEDISSPFLEAIVPRPPDGEANMLFRWTQGTSNVISIRNGHLAEINRFTLSGSTSPGPGGAPEGNYDKFVPQEIVDLEGNGHPQLLAVSSSGYSAAERAVYLLDLATGRTTWRYETAPFVAWARSIDMDGDGIKEVVFTGSAVANGRVGYDGTTDSQSWLYILDSRGKLKALKPIEGALSYVLPWTHQPPNGPGQLFVRLHRAPLQFGAPELHPINQIVKFNSSGDISRSYTLDGELQAVQIFTENGTTFLAISDGNGYITKLDSDLKTVARTQITLRVLDSANLKLGAPADMDGDGIVEIPVIGFQSQQLAPSSMGRNSEPPVSKKHRWPTFWLVSSSGLRVMDQFSLGEHWGADPTAGAVVLPGTASDPGTVVVVHQYLDFYKARSPASRGEKPR